MKRFIILVFFVIPFSCWAQTYFGVKVGYSPISTISFKPGYNQTPFYGEKPDFGLILKYYDNKWAGFQGELNFTQRGYNLPVHDTCQYRRVSDYVELPIIFQLHLKLTGGLYVHVGAGCYAAYMLSSKEGTDTTGKMVLHNYKTNILRDSKFDYGLVGGGGLSYDFKWGTIQLDVRIQYGFADLYKYNYTDAPQQSKSVVQNVNISYMYNFSKLKRNKKEYKTP